MNCGIYKITNLQNGKFYIGKSKNIQGRWATHLHELKVGRHKNVALQNDYNKLGRANFSFEIILYCQLHELTQFENEYIEKLSPEYNILMSGHPRYRQYIEPRLVGNKEEIVGLEKGFKPKPWHRWVYGAGRK